MLHYANGFPECFSMLINFPNIEVNKKNVNGNTPLHWAACWGDTECVQLLVAHPKIDVTIKNEVIHEKLCNQSFLSLQE